MKLMHRYAIAGCLVVFACCSMGNAESVATVNLKRAFRSLGYPRHEASEYSAKVCLAINEKFGRNFWDHAQEVNPKTLRRMIKKGTLGVVFTANEVMSIKQASLVMAAKLNKKFEDGKLSKEGWKSLRREARDMVCAWLTKWLKGQDRMAFQRRVMEAHQELAVLPEDKDTDDTSNASIELINMYDALAAVTEEEDIALAQALDTVVAETERAEEAAVEASDVQEVANVQPEPPSYLVDHNPFEAISASGDEEIKPAVVEKAPEMRVLKRVNSSPCFVHPNKFAVLRSLVS